MPHTHKAGKNITIDDDAVHHMRRLQLWDGCNGFIGHELLAGGADRFVEMEISRRECIESQGKGLHLMKKQLKLHMGWVKDIMSMMKIGFSFSALGEIEQSISTFKKFELIIHALPPPHHCTQQ